METRTAGDGADVFDAARQGDLERIQQLVVNEPSVMEAWSPDGWTALHVAAHRGHEAIAETLLRHGAAIEAPSRNDVQVTPLHAATARDHRSMVSLLLTFGADPNARQAGGWTPLHVAADHGDPELVKLLLDSHSEPSLASDDGQTALDVARARQHAEVVSVLESWTPGQGE